MSTIAGALRSTPLRTKQPRGRSGKLLVGSGLCVLTLGMFTDSLAYRIGIGGRDLSVLELGVLLVAAAVALAFGKYLLGKLKRLGGYGLLGAFGIGIGLPSLIALPAIGGVVRRLGSGLYSALPWVERSRWVRLLGIAGGPKGLASGCYGTVVFSVGAWTGTLSEEYLVFGYELSLLSVFVGLTVPGVVVYYLRR
ncbi:hypothetical protein [Natranaeroarchaeum sulfidigenes]|uniref:Uncharacterized protein n=1 Tax=Natranaeroarchaeum sulfidigenes TaxID=2784880 RepID=A0A897MLW3_9EURY|nr:hypothetical protein [Natranaeroarchaeum sulfidigenes]QSG01362.1 hypothetical protein AArcS_0122 [Natranaeroarchaeum sulfidigenes]